MALTWKLTEGKLDGAAMEDWLIATAADATPAESYAAEELRRWLEASTGREWQIAASGQEGAAQVRLLADAGLGEEEFRVEVERHGITIAGGRPRGVLYGMYQLLEDGLGVRFLTWDHTHVPTGMSIPCGTCHYAPKLSFRWSFYRENAERPEFAARLRVNTITDEERLGGKTGQNLINHSVDMLVPFGKHGQEHPEYYALVDGERDGDTRGGGPQLCVTNPKVVEIAAAAAIEHLNVHPELQNISVSQADTDRYCRCPACEEVNQREGTPMGSQLEFVNAVAERIEKVHPEVKVGTLAYWYTRKAPKTVRPRRNIQIQLCSIECCTLHAIDDATCVKNQEFCRDMEEWSAICDDIWIWNYNTNFRSYDLPFPNLRSIDGNVKYFLRNHAKGAFMQANGNGLTGELSDLRNYVIGRMLWDPEADGQELCREFVELHYREAAGKISEYLELLHDNAETRGVHPACFPKPEEVGLDADLARRGLGHFERALGLATCDEVRARVEKASISAHKAMIATEGWQDDGEREALIDRYVTLCRRYGMTHASENGLFDDYVEELTRVRQGATDG
ncbi:DUF4838 domain-containing protein [Candidatus Latescibacterota bacterium]